MAQDYSWEEGSDYTKTLSPLARLEAIIILYQLDIISAFLNGFINTEVYVKQPAEFEDVQLLEHRKRVDTSISKKII